MRDFQAGQHKQIIKLKKESKPVSDEEVRSMFQWCYNYIDKQKNSDEKTALIIELKNKGVL